MLQKVPHTLGSLDARAGHHCSEWQLMQRLCRCARCGSLSQSAKLLQQQGRALLHCIQATNRWDCSSQLCKSCQQQACTSKEVLLRHCRNVMQFVCGMQSDGQGQAHRSVHISRLSP